MSNTEELTKQISINSLDNASVTNFSPGDSAYAYKLVDYGNECAYAPYFTGYIYQKLDVVDEGDTKHWKVSIGTPYSMLGALATAYFEGMPSLASVAISLIVLTVENVVAYNQAIEVQTYTYNEMYKAVVNDISMIETIKCSKTYWEVFNNSTRVFEYELKSVNAEYPGTTKDLLEYAIGRYHNEFHAPNHIYTNDCDTKCDVCGEIDGERAVHIYTNEYVIFEKCGKQ